MLTFLLTILLSFAWGVGVSIMLSSSPMWQRLVIAGLGGFLIGYWVPNLLLGV